MPVTKSAAKRVRQNLKRHQRNLVYKRNIKRDVRALLTTIAKSDAEATAANLSKAQSSLDKAAKKNIIHKNKAARQKSRLAQLASGKKSLPTQPGAAKSKSKITTKAPAKTKSAADSTDIKVPPKIEQEK